MSSLILRQCVTLWGLFLFVANFAHGDPPRHWQNFLDTTREIRELVEEVSSGKTPNVEHIRRVQDGVKELISQPTVARELIDHLFGEGKLAAASLISDYRTIQMKMGGGDARVRDLLGDLGFSALDMALGFSEPPGEARTYFLNKVDHELKNIEGYQEALNEWFATEGKLRFGRTVLNQGVFATMMIVGLGVGSAAYAGLSYFGMRDLPLQRIAGAVGAGISTTVLGFQRLWEFTEEPLTRRLIKSRYEELVKSGIKLLSVDLKTALPLMTEVATQHGAYLLPNEAAALDSLLRFKSPETSEALIRLAILHIEKGHGKRAEKMLDEVILRDPKSDKGMFATEIRNVLQSKGDFERELGRVKRKYIGRNVFVSAAALGGGMFGLWKMNDQAINLTRAFVLQGIGLAGARVFFTKLWTLYPKKELTDKMEDRTKRLADSFQELLQHSEKQKNISPERKLELKRMSLAVLIGIVRNEMPKHGGELQRKAALEALQKMANDPASSYLALEARQTVLSESVRRQEPTNRLQEMEKALTGGAKSCAANLANIGRVGK